MDKPISSTSDSTSASLLDRVKASDQDAWRKLVRLYSPLVFYWCHQAGLQSNDAADVLQDVFRAVAAHIGDFHRGAAGAFRGWLFTITKNKLRDHFRRRQTRPQATGGTDALIGLQQIEEPFQWYEPPSGPSENLVVRRALDLVRAEFEVRTWQAFHRTTIDGAAPADVAAELGMSTAAVYKAKSRVLARLRDELRGLWESGA